MSVSETHIRVLPVHMFSSTSTQENRCDGSNSGPHPAFTESHAKHHTKENPKLIHTYIRAPPPPLSPLPPQPYAQIHGLSLRGWHNEWLWLCTYWLVRPTGNPYRMIFCCYVLCCRSFWRCRLSTTTKPTTTGSSDRLLIALVLVFHNVFECRIAYAMTGGVRVCECIGWWSKSPPTHTQQPYAFCFLSFYVVRLFAMASCPISGAGAGSNMDSGSNVTCVHHTRRRLML